MPYKCKQTVLNLQLILFIFLYFSSFGGFLVRATDNYDGSKQNITDSTSNHSQTAQNLHKTASNASIFDRIISYDPLAGFEKQQKSGDVNLAFLPSFALILFIVLICLRVCVWYREEFKYKSRGCSYDITSYVILSQGDDKFRNIDIKSDTNSYDTYNSISSFLRRNPQIHDTIHSTGSLQTRIDAKIYETVRSYTPILRKAQNTDTELQAVPANKRSRKTSVQNSYTVSYEEKEVRIKDTRFRVVPALDNHMRNINMRTVHNNSFKSKTSSQSDDHPSETDLQSDQKSEPASPKSEVGALVNKKVMVDAETQISTPSKRRRTSSGKRRRNKDTSSTTSSYETNSLSASLGDSIPRINEGVSLSINSNSASQNENNLQSNDKNRTGSSEFEHQLQYTQFSNGNLNSSSVCDLADTGTQTPNVMYVTAMVHNQSRDYINRDTETDSGNSKRKAGKAHLEMNNTNDKLPDSLKINGLVNKPYLRSALSYPSIVSNVFVESTNANNNNTTNGFVRHHRYHSWNIGYSNKICSCTGPSSESNTKGCERSEVQNPTCILCYLHNNDVRNNVELINAESDHMIGDQKENQEENTKKQDALGTDCPLNNSDSAVRNIDSSLNYVNGDAFRIDIDMK